MSIVPARRNRICFSRDCDRSRFISNFSFSVRNSRNSEYFDYRLSVTPLHHSLFPNQSNKYSLKQNLLNYCSCLNARYLILSTALQSQSSHPRKRNKRILIIWRLHSASICSLLTHECMPIGARHFQWQGPRSSLQLRNSISPNVTSKLNKCGPHDLRQYGLWKVVWSRTAQESFRS